MSHYMYSAMSAREEFKLNGELSLATQEQLIDFEEDTRNLDDLGIYADEVYPYVEDMSWVDTDELASILQQLRLLAKRVRGDNQLTVNTIIDRLDSEISTIINTNGYNVDLKYKVRDAAKRANDVRNFINA